MLKMSQKEVVEVGLDVDALVLVYGPKQLVNDIGGKELGGVVYLLSQQLHGLAPIVDFSNIRTSISP